LEPTCPGPALLMSMADIHTHTDTHTHTHTYIYIYIYFKEVRDVFNERIIYIAGLRLKLAHERNG
jgi:hypothetical protein